jgi:hypothetical protein
MVRLERAGRYEGPRAFFHRVGDQELELTRLVAAEGEARLIVTLYEQAGTAQEFRQPGHRLDRRRQVGEAHAGDLVHSMLLSCRGSLHPRIRHSTQRGGERKRNG